MHIFFCPKKDISSDNASIFDRRQVHHIRDVLRIKEGEEIAIFSEDKIFHSAQVESLGADKIILKLKGARWAKPKTIKLAVACAIPKNSRIDELIDKLTQVGVDRIIPLVTKRTVVKLDDKKKKLRRQRWDKIILGAVQQSQRADFPELSEVMDFNRLLAEVKNYELCLIPHLSGQRQSLKQALEKKKAKSILVLIGPEGDFTPEEVARALSQGCVPVTLGDNVLRVETAAVVIASFIRLYELF